MKKIIISLVVALCPLALVAQQKIAMVNTQEIMAALPETTAAQTRLQELDAKYTQEVQKSIPPRWRLLPRSKIRSPKLSAKAVSRSL